MVDRGADATLYVIPGSHACRTGMLLLEHKGIPYRPVNLITLLHPVAVRMLGFGDRTDRARRLGGRHPRLALGDRLGTVPALRFGGRRVQTNHDIARFLDRAQPDPPLMPSDGGQRRAVEEAESWGDDVFQMSARRLALAAAMRGGVRDDGEDGRLGYLLYRSRRMRMRMVPLIGRYAFDVDEQVEAQLRDELPEMLDRIDGWIAAGVLDGERLNAADYVIAPSLALLTYSADLERQIRSRPAERLVDRVLPEPAQRGSR